MGGAWEQSYEDPKIEVLHDETMSGKTKQSVVSIPGQMDSSTETTITPSSLIT